MAERLKAGIAGFGTAGRNMHYRSLVEGLGDLVEVAAVWNRSGIPREGRRPDDFPLADDVAIYNDYDEFLAHPGLDVVHVTTPSGLHGAYIVPAARAGKHVIADKPVEVTLAKVDEAVGACAASGVTLAVSFQRRFAPHCMELRRLIDDGALGDIVAGSVECKLYRTREYYSSTPWRATWELDGGGALMNQSIHYIDLLQWFMGSPANTVTKGIYDRLIHPDIEAEDYGYGELVLDNGADMSILGGTSFRPGISEELTVMGTRGWATVTGESVTKACWDGRDRRDLFRGGAPTAGSVSSPALKLDNHKRFFRATYEALARGDETPVSGAEARKSTEIILGIYRAAETGGPVSLPLDGSWTPSGVTV